MDDNNDNADPNRVTNVTHNATFATGNLTPVPENVVTLAIGSLNGECNVPTMNIRQVLPPVGQPYMQQRWVDPMTGRGEWRNIPVVCGFYPNRSPD